jgi:hypothetical protein
MASIPEAIGQLKAAFLDIVPPIGFSVGNRVWAWPADRGLINYETFPFIICAEALNEEGVWRFIAQGSRSHTWPALILICLSDFASRDDTLAEYEAVTPAWLLAGAKVLFDSEGNEGGPLRLGSSSKQFTSRIGNIGWIDEKVFWGISFRVPVTQSHGLTDEECD